MKMRLLQNRTAPCARTAVFAVLLFCPLLFSQAPVRRLQADMSGGAGVSFEFWQAKNDKITELSIPVTFIYPYSPKMTFYAVTAPAVSNVSAGENHSLSGLSDLKWGGHYLAFNDRCLFTFGVNLPTGKHALESDEYAVASVLVIPAFNFRVPTLGQGFDVQAGVSSAREMGEFVVGYGLSYLMKGAYKPFKGVDQSYNPGDELTLTVGAEKNLTLFNKAMRVTGDAMYSIYFNDTWEGDDVFRSGNRLLIQLVSSFKMEPFDMTVFVRERIKGKNKTGAGELFETERKSSNANQFEILGCGYYPYDKNIRLKGLVDFKLYSSNDYGTGGATLFGLGGGGQVRLSPQMVFNGDLRFYFGSIKTASQSAATIGLKLFGGIEYAF